MNFGCRFGFRNWAAHYSHCENGFAEQNPEDIFVTTSTNPEYKRSIFPSQYFFILFFRALNVQTWLSFWRPTRAFIYSLLVPIVPLWSAPKLSWLVNKESLCNPTENMFAVFSSWEKRSSWKWMPESGLCTTFVSLQKSLIFCFFIYPQWLRESSLLLSIVCSYWFI